MKIKLYQCGGENSISEYPLGLGYLKTNCKADIEIVKKPEDLKECDLIGLSSNAWGIREAVSILEGTKIPVAIGGQATLWDGLRQFPFKYIVKGEGEQALQSIISGNQGKWTPCEPVDIDCLIPPDRGKCGKVVPILTSRGCPFNCAFCSARSFWGTVRYHSAEYVMKEVESILERYPQVETLYFLDDLFIGNRKRFGVLYDQWMEKELYKRLILWGFVRADMIDLSMAVMMKLMGFQHIRFGAESGSDRVLKLMNKKATVKDNQRVIDIGSSLGLPVTASFIYDIPGETEEDKKATKDFIARNKGKLSVEGWYKFKPFPGTSLYRGENPLEIDMRVRA